MTNHINYFNHPYYRLQHLNSNDFLNPIDALSYGNIDPELYLGYKNYGVKKLDNNLLSNIVKSHIYILIELSLYLDVNPGDKNALMLYQNYSNNLKVALEKYEQINGPLSILSTNVDFNKWCYLKNWPWERGDK